MARFSDKARCAALVVLSLAVGVASLPATASAQFAGMQIDSVTAKIRGVQHQGGSDAWDRSVLKILVATYDKDRSGWIDTQPEVAAIPCDVLLAMDKLIKPYNKGRSGLAWTYGFQPDTAGKLYSYLGTALGFSRQMRQVAYNHIAECGVRTR